MSKKTTKLEPPNPIAEEAPKAKPLFVELSVEDRARLEALREASEDATGFRVTTSDIVRQLVREASKRSTPVRLGR